MHSDLDIYIYAAIETIKRFGAKHVGLQTPEGLKRAAPAIARRIEQETGAEVVISGDPCYGACDIDTDLAEEVDILVHLGHSELGGGPDNVIYVESRDPADLSPAIRAALPMLRSKRIGLATTVQHVHKLNQAIDLLMENGIEGLVGPAGGRIKYPGQVLGCCYTSIEPLDVDEYLFIGTGRFHPLGMALSTGKRVIAADPITGEAFEIDPEPMLRKRYGAITRAMDARKFAIIISKKPGQRRREEAERLKKMGEAHGREMILVYLDNLEPDRLLNFGVDAAVCTACPRIALDDAAKYKVPILTPPEFEVLLRERKWEEYIFDEII